MPYKFCPNCNAKARLIKVEQEHKEIRRSYLCRPCHNIFTSIEVWESKFEALLQELKAFKGEIKVRLEEDKYKSIDKWFDDKSKRKLEKRYGSESYRRKNN